MRFANNPKVRWLLAAAVVAIAIPAISQDAPKSLLPPGFGDSAPEAQKPAPSEPPAKTTDLLPDLELKPPPSGEQHSTYKANDDPALSDVLPGLEGEDPEAAAAPALVLQDLPASARRSTANIGVLNGADGDMGAAAFGDADGKYLSHLMRSVRAPIASRWASIVLRRALISNVNTPGNLNGADWAAERAWLLLRMGEAEMARMLVQSVDIDQYSPKMFQVAMQASLANGDSAGLCPMVEPAMKVSDESAWLYARAICSGLSGESSTASAQIDSAESKGGGNNVDGLLAEKVIGAGGNTRRAVTIEWENVRELTTWRYGMATATGVAIPDRLMASADNRVRAWRARAPLFAADNRTNDADIAAALGIFSSEALVDLYGAVADEGENSTAGEKRATMLRAAYVATEPTEKLAAMQTLWKDAAANPLVTYSRLILTARAAGRLVPNSSMSGDSDNILASMMTAGLDVQAAKWAGSIGSGKDKVTSKAWGLLAVGAPGKAVEWSKGDIKNYVSNASQASVLRGKLLVASMAGLGRISAGDVASLANELQIPLEQKSSWTNALDRAVAAHQPATVALLCALGLEASDWRGVKPGQLYRVISALRQVGLENEARMIAAEALTRT